MMRKFLFLPIAVLVIVVFTATAKAQNSQVRSSMIVSTEWLAKHLNDKSLVLLEVGEKAEYAAAHIPGAQFLQYADISTPRGQGLSLELPPVAQLKTTFEKLGVSDKSRIGSLFRKVERAPRSECRSAT